MINKFSKTGTYHKANGKENQDAVFSGENKRFAVIALADGVSECKEAKTGAEIAGKAITNLFLQKGEYFMEFEKEQTAKLVISHILYELRKKAESDAENTAAYSSTAASVLLDKKTKKMLFFSLGDSIIIAVKDKKCDILAKPSDSRWGCYVTTTEGAESAAKTNVINASEIDSVVICSDGAWKNMFDGNRLKNEVRTIIEDCEYDELKKFIQAQNGFDDSSFVSIDLRKIHRRKKNERTKLLKESNFALW